MNEDFERLGRIVSYMMTEPSTLVMTRTERGFAVVRMSPIGRVEKGNGESLKEALDEALMGEREASETGL